MAEKSSQCAVIVILGTPLHPGLNTDRVASLGPA